MSDPFIGEIRLFAGRYAPEDWSFCDGSLLPIQGNEALYSLIGCIYGGDGKTNFALPNLNGRVVVGAGSPDNTHNYVIGMSGGNETVALTIASMPTHTHSVQVSSTESISSSPNSTMTFGKVSDSLHFYTDTSQGTNGSRNFSGSAIGSTNFGPTPHNNIMPSLVINSIICRSGLYPSFE